MFVSHINFVNENSSTWPTRRAISLFLKKLLPFRFRGYLKTRLDWSENKFHINLKMHWLKWKNFFVNSSSELLYISLLCVLKWTNNFAWNANKLKLFCTRERIHRKTIANDITPPLGSFISRLKKLNRNFWIPLKRESFDDWGKSQSEI